MSRKYIMRSKEEKLAVVKEVLAGKPIRSWEPEISGQLVGVWVKKYQAEGEAGLEPKRRPGDPLARFRRRKELSYTEQLQYQVELLKRELAEKEAEVARLKNTKRTKGGRYPKNVIRQMYAKIQRQAGERSVEELCAIYGVSRSGYYKWRRRQGKLNRYKQAQQVLDARVSDIHAHHPMMGYRSIRDMLALHFGLEVSDPSVFKSMQRLHIHGYCRKVRNRYSGLEHTRYPNLLKRDFKADGPMRKVVTDVTYIKHRGKWYYLAAYLDLYNNEILEWELSDTFDNLLVMRPAERLLKRTKSTGRQVLLHSDQGVQYSSAGYCNLLKEYNVLQSMSRAGVPRDNAVMESFWGRFKDTLRKHFRYRERDDLHDVVAECVHYFNFVRPVRKLNGKPPALFRAELVA